MYKCSRNVLEKNKGEIIMEKEKAKKVKELRIINGKTMGTLITKYCKETITREGDIHFIIGMLVGKSGDRPLVESAITNYFFMGAYMGKKYPQLFEIKDRMELPKKIAKDYMG